MRLLQRRLTHPAVREGKHKERQVRIKEKGKGDGDGMDKKAGSALKGLYGQLYIIPDRPPEGGIP